MIGRHATRSLGLAAILVLASCAPRPVPPPAPAPRPAPPPAALPPPPPRAWQDAPLSAGDWSLEGQAARFGGAEALLVLRCEAGRQVSITRPGGAGGRMVVRTSFGERTVAATAEQGRLVARLDAFDPLLDSIAFSRGRFAVEAEGAVPLILPAWPEPARIVEDCRQ